MRCDADTDGMNDMGWHVSMAMSPWPVLTDADTDGMFR